MNNSIHHVVGIDIAKASFTMRLMVVTNVPEPVGTIQLFPNTTDGYQQAFHWLGEHGADLPATQVVLEATGVYWEACALCFHEHGFVVSVVNPAQVKYFSRTTLMRGKTDAMDADLLARFAAMMQPRIWSPPSVEMEQLRLIMRQRDSYVGMLTEEKNRLHALKHRAHTPHQIIKITQKHIQFLEQRIGELEQAFKDTLVQSPQWQKSLEVLMSIPGLGLITAGTLLTETCCFSTFVDARQLAAYAGLSPSPYLSGTSVHRKTTISKIGNARLRRALYMASVSSIRSHSMLKQFYHRLRSQGKPAKVALVAVARKILTIAFALFQSQQPFDPFHVSKRTSIEFCS